MQTPCRRKLSPPTRVTHAWRTRGSAQRFTVGHYLHRSDGGDRPEADRPSAAPLSIRVSAAGSRPSRKQSALTADVVMWRTYTHADARKSDGGSAQPRPPPQKAAAASALRAKHSFAAAFLIRDAQRTRDDARIVRSAAARARRAERLAAFSAPRFKTPTLSAPESIDSSAASASNESITSTDAFGADAVWRLPTPHSDSDDN